MKLKTRLIVAFLLLAVVPLGAVTIYSYLDSAKALQVVAVREAQELDGELIQHMQLVTAQLSQRVEQLMNVSVLTGMAPVTGLRQSGPAAASARGGRIDASRLNAQAAAALGESVLLLEAVEVRELSGPRGGVAPATPNATGASGAPGSLEESDRVEINLGPISLDMFNQVVPEGTNPSKMSLEQRQRVGIAINRRMLGIVDGIKLEPPQTASAAMTRKSALSGNRLDVVVEQEGKVVRAAKAEINLLNLLMTVFISVSRAQGEVPYAVGTDGHIYTQTEANRETVERLAPASLPDGASTAGHGDWIVVMTTDPTGSGLRLGIARPVGDSISELRRTAGRNAGLGLVFIALAIVGIVPLSGRLTRSLSTLTDGVRRIADGDYRARVSVTTDDEIGDLARAFNQMADDVERHQRTALDQERIKRELELGRQIQHDMLPSEPLQVGLTEIEGTSVPAREVGGDFFNYFVLPDGQVALLVGDVSGRGVGAALLMANIQSSLRTRLTLGQDLSAVVDAIDRDVGAHSPGTMYATLFLSTLNPATRALRYVSAGHNPQYVLRAGGELEHTELSGMPVGMFAGRGYKERRVQLAVSDLLFLYTDGCVETENDAEDMFGTERLEALLTRCRAERPHGVLQRVAGALSEFRGARELFDDATMMAVKIG
jgi:serine phosphatase RsbU (regulator of sigma subunit)